MKVFQTNDIYDFKANMAYSGKAYFTDFHIRLKKKNTKKGSPPVCLHFIFHLTTTSIFIVYSETVNNSISFQSGIPKKICTLVILYTLYKMVKMEK